MTQDEKDATGTRRKDSFWGSWHQIKDQAPIGTSCHRGPFKKNRWKTLAPQAARQAALHIAEMKDCSTERLNSKNIEFNQVCSK